MSERVAAAGLQSPTLIMVGNVVTLCPTWQEAESVAGEGAPAGADSGSTEGSPDAEGQGRRAREPVA